MNLEFAKVLYFRELDARVQNDGRFGTFVALLSALGGALAFLTSRAFPGPTIWLQVGLVFSIVAVVLYVLAVIWALRSAIGFGYEVLPHAHDLLEHWRELSLYYKLNPDVSDSAREDFEESLLVRLTSAATTNARNNLTRSARLSRVGHLVLVIVVLVAVAAGTLAVDRFASPHLQPGGSPVSDSPKPSQPTSKPVQQPAPQPAPLPPPKPVMPQNVIQKGGAEKPASIDGRQKR